MTSFLRGAARGKAFRALFSFDTNLLRSALSPSSHHCLRAPPQQLHSHLHRISQLPGFLRARHIAVRDYSTTQDASSGEAAIRPYEFESQGILERENVCPRSYVEESVSRLTSAESLDDELGDSDDSIAAAETGSLISKDSVDDELNDSDDTVDAVYMRTLTSAGDSGDSDEALTTAEISDVESESVTAEEGEDENGDTAAEDEDSGTWMQSIDISNLPDSLEGMPEDDDAFENEGLAIEGDVELLTLEEVKEVLQNVRARDVQIFLVHDRCEWTDVMVLATGISDRHVRGIADALVYKIKKKPHIDPTLYPTIEGQVGGRWLIVDCGNIIVHALNEESRAYYKLENLWTQDVKPTMADEDLERMLKTAGLAVSQ